MFLLLFLRLSHKGEGQWLERGIASEKPECTEWGREDGRLETVSFPLRDSSETGRVQHGTVCPAGGLPCMHPQPLSELKGKRKGRFRPVRLPFSLFLLSRQRFLPSVIRPSLE